MAIDTLGANALASDSVTTAKIVNDAVTAAKIPAGAVVADIADGGITTAKLADDAITGDKLANDIAISTTGNIATTGSGTITSAGLITASGSVAIGGTGSANTLDDYEEGTFSPTLENQGNSNLTTTKRSTNLGAYVKVGSAVHFQMLIHISALSGDDSSNLQVANMPFVGKPSATHGGFGGGICTYSAAVDTNPTYALVLDGSDNMRLYISPTNPMLSNMLQATSYIVIFGYYETSS